MDIIIAIVFIVVLVITVGLTMYLSFKKNKKVMISCEDDLDKLIEFSKSNNSK